MKLIFNFFWAFQTSSAVAAVSSHGVSKKLPVSMKVKKAGSSPHSLIKKWQLTGTEEVKLRSVRPKKGELLVGLLRRPRTTPV